MIRVNEHVKQTIKDAVDVEVLLRSLGFNIYRTTGSEIRAPCKLHGGDNPTSFSLRTDTKRWLCFTRKCHEINGSKIDNDLVTLVMKILGLSFIDSLQYLSDFSGLSIDVKSNMVEESSSYRRAREDKEYIKLVNKTNQALVPIVSTVDESLVESYIANRDSYFLKQGFLPETLEYFEIGLKTDEEGINRATIPIRDENGRLVSISARRVDSSAEPRYKIDRNFQKGRVLYNLDKALVNKKNYILLVEGFKALWSVYESGETSVAACMGTSVSFDQAALLARFGYERCFLMFDGDSPGFKGMVSAKKKLDKFLRTFIIMLPENTSPDDFKRDELKEYISVYKK